MTEAFVCRAAAEGLFEEKQEVYSTVGPPSKDSSGGHLKKKHLGFGSMHKASTRLLWRDSGIRDTCMGGA